MAGRIPADHPLRRLFREATRYAYENGPVPFDSEIASYVSDEILSEFVHVNNLFKIRSSIGKRLEEIAEILLEIDNTPIDKPVLTFRILKHVGDYTLFITGVFPESLKRLEKKSSDYLLGRLESIIVPCKSIFDFYRLQGKRSYLESFRLAEQLGMPDSDILKRLSSEFDALVGILNLVRTYLDSLPEFDGPKQIMLGEA
jgi:hypothetical protein